MDEGIRRSGKRYCKLVRRLMASNLVCFRRTARCDVGVFTVNRKDGRQRVVVDARLANTAYDSPDPVHLATGGAFAYLDAQPETAICVGGTDIRVAFYAMLLPPELVEDFGLPALRAGDVGVTSVQGVAVGASTMIRPCLAVLPMGWTQALWACQLLHDEVVTRDVNIVEEQRFVDGKPCPELKPVVHTSYVDNFVSLSQSLSAASELTEAARRELRAIGLSMHPAEASAGGETLGWSFSPSEPVVAASSRCMWRVRLGAKELLRRKCATSHELRSLLGQYTSRCLIRRELLSVCSAVYAFVEEHSASTVAVPLWGSVCGSYVRWRPSSC